jgi:hypothetical protein
VARAPKAHLVVLLVHHLCRARAHEQLQQVEVAVGGRRVQQRAAVLVLGGHQRLELGAREDLEIRDVAGAGARRRFVHGRLAAGRAGPGRGGGRATC